MIYTAFKEEHTSIRVAKYLNLKNKLTKNKDNVTSRDKTYRRIFFEIPGTIRDGKDNYLNNTDTFSIYWENTLYHNLYLEKISRREDNIYKQRVPLTRQNYLDIEAQNYQWLKDSSLGLLNDLYLQISMNMLRIGDVYEYKREIITIGEEQSSIHFTKSVTRTEGELFGNNLYRQECLSENEVLMSYRKNTTIPTIYANAFNYMERQPQVNVQ